MALPLPTLSVRASRAPREAPSRRRRVHTRQGAAAVEFAVTTPMLILLIFGGLELSLLLDRAQLVQAAANAGAQAGASVREPPPATGSSLRAVAEAHAAEALSASGLDCDGACTIDATWQASGGWQLLTVEITAPYTALSAYPWLPGNLTRRSTTWTVTQD